MNKKEIEEHLKGEDNLIEDCKKIEPQSEHKVIKVLKNIGLYQE